LFAAKEIRAQLLSDTSATGRSFRSGFTDVRSLAQLQWLLFAPNKWLSADQHECTHHCVF